MIRRIRNDDWPALAQVRLRALLTDPQAFGSSYAQEVALDAAAWEVRAVRGASGRAQFLAVSNSDGEFTGMAGGYQPQESPMRRELYGMWVAPEARSTGVGAGLVQAVLAWSRDVEAAGVDLWVVDANPLARRLYARAGFTESGETQPLPSDPSLTEIRMTFEHG